MILKFKKIFKVSLFILLASSIGCKESSSIINNVAIIKGPYVQMLRQTEITIVWEGDSLSNGKVYYGVDNELNLMAKSEGTSQVKKVTLINLQPETTYQYQVEVNGFKSQVNEFRTAVKNGSSFKFAAYGDNKNGPFNHKKIADLILSYKPLFVSNNGDLVDRGSVYKQWEKLFFTPTQNLIASVPLIPAIGNHEDNSKYYYNYFCLPENKAWHSFDLNGAHFVVINTEEEFLEENGEQLTWLKNDLANNISNWIFVFQHIPPFTSGGNYYSRERINVKNILHPIFEKYKVDIVITGHDHHYERSKPVTSINGNHAVTYIVGGNGGTPMRYIGKPKEFSLISKRIFGFVLIEINGLSLKFKEISIDNEILDEFELDKSSSTSIAQYMQNKIYFENIHDPETSSKLYSKGKKAFQDDNYQEALNYLLEAYKVDNHCEEATAMLAEVYFELNDYENARKFANITINNAPLHPDSYSIIAKIYEKVYNYEETINWYKKQLTVEPDSPKALEDIASIYEDLDQPELVEGSLREAIRILPNDADLHFKLARFYDENGKITKAKEHYEIGIEWFMDEEESERYQLALKRVKELNH